MRTLTYHKDTSLVCDYNLGEHLLTEEGEEEEEEEGEAPEPDKLPGKFYSMQVKLQEPIYIPPEGSEKIVLGDLGNGIIITEKEEATKVHDKAKLIKKYYKHFPDEQKETNVGL